MTKILKILSNPSQILGLVLSSAICLVAFHAFQWSKSSNDPLEEASAKVGAAYQKITTTNTTTPTHSLSEAHVNKLNDTYKRVSDIERELSFYRYTMVISVVVGVIILIVKLCKK